MSSTLNTFIEFHNVNLSSRYIRIYISFGVFWALSTTKIGIYTYNALHVALMRSIAIQKRTPLVGRDPQPRFGRDLNDLRVVFASERLVRTELLLKLH